MDILTPFHSDLKPKRKWKRRKQLSMAQRNKEKFKPIMSLLVNSNQPGSYAMKRDKKVHAQKHLI